MTFSDSAKFRCNICGTICDRPPEGIDREGVSCPTCHSSGRVRAVFALLAEEMLGVQMTLAEFPVLKGIRGFGMSDSRDLAERLAQKLDYTNTFYHQAPRLDITQPDPNDYGRYDFILTSEVMEHVPQPIEQAFVNLFRLLKPDGLLIMTTPYSLGGKTKEHFPDLHEFTLAAPGGKSVLVNRRRDGAIEVFENLVFHGGPGSTVEMRVFTEASLLENILAAGFSSARVASEDLPEFGIEHAQNWSLPIVARKGTFRPPVTEMSGEYRKARRLATHLEEQLAIQLNDYKDYVAHHETWHTDAERLLAERYQWGTDLDRELTERTEWAQSLDRHVGELRARLVAAQEEQARLEGRKWMHLGRKLGLID